jgi:hypothetical protein
MNDHTQPSAPLPVPAKVMAFTREVAVRLKCSPDDPRTEDLARAILAAPTLPGTRREKPTRIGDKCSCGGKLEYQAAEPEVNWPESFVCDECGYDFLDEAKASDEDAKEGC